MQRLVLMAEGQLIAVRHLPQQILHNSTARQEALLIPEEGIVFDQEIARIEAAYLQAALRRSEGKKTGAQAAERRFPKRSKQVQAFFSGCRLL